MCVDNGYSIYPISIHTNHSISTRQIRIISEKSGSHFKNLHRRDMYLFVTVGVSWANEIRTTRVFLFIKISEYWLCFFYFIKNYINISIRHIVITKKIHHNYCIINFLLASPILQVGKHNLIHVHLLKDVQKKT